MPTSDRSRRNPLPNLVGAVLALSLTAAGLDASDLVTLEAESSGQYVRAGIGKGSQLGLAGTRVGGWQIFELVSRSSDGFGLRSNHSGRYVTISGNRPHVLIASTENAGAAEIFQVASSGDTVTLRSASTGLWIALGASDRLTASATDPRDALMLRSVPHQPAGAEGPEFQPGEDQRKQPPLRIKAYRQGVPVDESLIPQIFPPGPAPYATVPSVIRMTRDQAERALSAAHLRLRAGEPWLTVEERLWGKVAWQSPSHAKQAPRESPVTVRFYARNPDRIAVPPVYNLHYVEAQRRLALAGLGSGEQFRGCGELTHGNLERCRSRHEQVDSTSPPAGAGVARGGVVELFVTRMSGRMVNVPEVSFGFDRPGTAITTADACRRLREAGLLTRIAGAAQKGCRSDGRVVRQNPEGGVAREWGSAVELVVCFNGAGRIPSEWATENNLGANLECGG